MDSTLRIAGATPKRTGALKPFKITARTWSLLANDIYYG